MARDWGYPATNVRRWVRDNHYAYMICCANGTLYTGYTTDVEGRIAAHNAGKGGNYTRSNRPVMLLAAWRFNSRSEALHAERYIKRLPRDKKLALAEKGASAQGTRS